MRNDVIQVIRKGDCIEVWIPPVNDPEGDLIATLDTAYVPALIAQLKRFEQTEGRAAKRQDGE